ncbi:low temperature requirement protein A [Alsobacter metallidurans]|uniref:low temperature requirement protein A n=1 Tax=Alsobacter metallidurans TaxID=340221 RepID=UPI0035309818
MAVSEPKPAANNSELLRGEPDDGHHRVTYVELFFDLVFVFAVTQLSHTLAAQFDAWGVLQAFILMLAVWWVWIDTSWVTNWLNPDRTPVRAVIFGLMLAGLGLSISIPKAFGDRAILFAVCYGVMQVARSIFAMWATPRDEEALRTNFTRILAWHCAGAAFWLAGASAPDAWRLGLWAVAVVIASAGPLTRFWTPGLGASAVSDWNVEGGHMAERCGLFIIIALGESILVTGATFADAPWKAWTIVGFVSSFVASLAMWWIYFDLGAEAGSREIADADDPGRLARLAYTYLHLPIMAGVIVTAVGDEFVLDHPDGHGELRTLLTVVGGPLLFLTGAILFKRAVRGFFQLSHLVGIGLLGGMLAAGALLTSLPPALLSVLSTTCLVVVAVWESWSFNAHHHTTQTSAKHD